MKNIYLYITLIYFMLLSSCYITFNKSKLNFSDVKYTDTNMFNMKTNGYYYYLGNDSMVSHLTYVNRVQVAKYKPINYILPIIFYPNNNIAHFSSFIYEDTISSVDKQNIKQGSESPFIGFQETLNTMNKNSYRLIDWGYYNVKNDSLRFRIILPENVGTVLPIATYNVYEYLSIITNDSTFKTIRYYLVNKPNNYITLNRVYHFKQYENLPKPKE